MAIIKDRAFLNEDGSVGGQLLVKCLAEHAEEATERLQQLEDYYNGEHIILEREFETASLPNNKIVCNHAEYITDIATGYVHGAPVQYNGEGSEDLNDLFTQTDEDSHNKELAEDISKFGRGYELLYMSDDDNPIVKMAVLNPLNTFLVVDDTVEHKPMFGCTYRENRDINGTRHGYIVTIYTAEYIYTYRLKTLVDTSPELAREPFEHYFGDVPLIEYKNKKNSKGDFEGVISIIDAYNLIQSDRVNDKEQLIDAILAVTGASLGDDMDEMSNTAKLLKQHKMLELPEGGDAKYLVKNLVETELEVLKKALKDDIHEFSKVPCLTDENFVGNSSGVAMKYKLFGLEQLGMTKERYFKKGLRQRLKMIARIDNIKAKITDASAMDIVMTRTLPVDDEMLAKIAKETEGLISWETRVKRFDAEIDVEAERKRLDEERKAAANFSKIAYGLDET